MDTFTAAAGFSTRRRDASNQVKGFGPTLIRLVCACGRKRGLQAQSRKSSTTKAADCPWRCQLKALHCNGRKWTLELGKDDYLVVKLREGELVFSPLASRLIAEGYDLTMFKEDEINLETAFMHLTKGITS